MPINSKQKGKNGELEICRVLKKHGFDVRRSVQYNGKAEDGLGDIVGIDGIHAEIKRVESLNITKAMEQATEDARDGEMPTVFHRKNGKPWLVTMHLDDWVKLYKGEVN